MGRARGHAHRPYVWYLQAELERRVFIDAFADTRRTTPSHPPEGAAALPRERSPRPDGRPLADVDVAIVGPGRAGLSVALALRDAGARIVGHVGRSEDGSLRAERLLGVSGCADMTELVAVSRADPAPTTVFMLSVPDRSIGDTARALAAELLREAPARQAPTGPAGSEPVHAVMHLSGATTVDQLDPCAQAGALTFSFHPLQTLPEPTDGPRRLKGASIAVTPGTSALPSDSRIEAAWYLGRRLALAVSARPFRLVESDRVLYHAAAVFASNYLVALIATAEELFVRSGIDHDEALAAFLPLVHGAVDSVAATGPVDALTGPLSRGDASTIERHLKALDERAPHLTPIYRALGSATLALVRRRGDVPAAIVNALDDLLHEGSHT